MTNAQDFIVAFNEFCAYTHNGNEEEKTAFFGNGHIDVIYGYYRADKDSRNCDKKNDDVAAFLAVKA
jgi:hypothetical protein